VTKGSDHMVMELVALMGWIGSALCFSGTVMASRKMKVCWVAMFIGGILIVTQNYILGTWNLVFFESLYIPLAVYGWIRWNKASEDEFEEIEVFGVIRRRS